MLPKSSWSGVTYMAKNTVDLSATLHPVLEVVLKTASIEELHEHLPFGTGSNTDFVLKTALEAGKRNRENSQTTLKKFVKSITSAIAALTPVDRSFLLVSFN